MCRLGYRLEGCEIFFLTVIQGFDWSLLQTDLLMGVTCLPPPCSVQVYTVLYTVYCICNSFKIEIFSKKRRNSLTRHLLKTTNLNLMSFCQPCKCECVPNWCVLLSELMKAICNLKLAGNVSVS